MSRNNVEIVRAFFEAYNREDFDAALKDAAPGFVLDFSRSLGPYRGVYGLNQIRELFEEINGTFASVRFEPHDFIDADDYVIVPVTTHFRGRDEIEVSARVTHLWKIHDGAVLRVWLLPGAAGGPRGRGPG
jgi:ketosteroid isomerase-like protein